MEIIEKRRKQREEMIERVTEFARQLNNKCTVLLIGSYARGDFNLWSDVDLLIIGNFTGNPLQRLKNIDLPAGFEAILLTPEEFNIRKGKNEGFIKEALQHGIVVRDDFGLIS